MTPLGSDRLLENKVCLSRPPIGYCTVCSNPLYFYRPPAPKPFAIWKGLEGEYRGVVDYLGAFGAIWGERSLLVL
jgi:hypothetical protein